MGTLFPIAGFIPKEGFTTRGFNEAPICYLLLIINKATFYSLLHKQASSIRNSKQLGRKYEKHKQSELRCR
jgi:hypothetical protein